MKKANYQKIPGQIPEISSINISELQCNQLVELISPDIDQPSVWSMVLENGEVPSNKNQINNTMVSEKSEKPEKSEESETNKKKSFRNQSRRRKQKRGQRKKRDYQKKTDSKVQKMDQNKTMKIRKTRLRRKTSKYQPNPLSHYTNNLLKLIKRVHFVYIMDKMGEQFVQDHPILKNIQKKKGACMEDFSEMYKIPQLQSVFKQYFDTNKIQQDLEKSGANQINKDRWRKLLFNFQEVFKTKEFLYIKDPDKKKPQQSVA